MINVKEPKKVKSCNMCLNDKNTIEIDFHRNGQGIIVILCENCAKELIEKLEAHMGSNHE